MFLSLISVATRGLRTTRMTNPLLLSYRSRFLNPSRGLCLQSHRSPQSADGKYQTIKLPAVVKYFTLPPTSYPLDEIAESTSLRIPSQNKDEDPSIFKDQIFKNPLLLKECLYDYEIFHQCVGTAFGAFTVIVVFYSLDTMSYLFFSALISGWSIWRVIYHFNALHMTIMKSNHMRSIEKSDVTN